MSKLNYKNIENPQSIEDFLNFARFQLKNLENPKLESEMLLSFVLKKDRVWIKTHTKDILHDNEAKKFKGVLEKRKNNIPFAYIIGYKIWNELKIEVSPDVLIPRDETEILAHYIVENSRDFEVGTILDIGTGSGCLSIFCGKKFPKAKITSIDISNEVLDIAKKNAKNNNVEIKFLQSDLLSNISQNFDIIIANLPYVPEGIEITEDVKKEPHNAIFSGEDGLDLIRRLAKQIKSHEILFQELWLEFWTEQETEIAEIFKDYKVKFYPDLSGKTYFAKITSQE